MSKSLLHQALKFKDATPRYSEVEKLCALAKKYQLQNDTVFIYAKYRERAKILNVELFFEFLSNGILENDAKIKSFDDIQKILYATTREENIVATGDSKNSIVRVFDNVVVFQSKNANPVLYKNLEDIPFSKEIVAVENAETFLNIFSLMSAFGYESFVYLGGFSNSLTREFLKDKDVVFFLDYDIEAMRIYDSFECRNKSFFRHPEIESYFQTAGNQKLYLKQRAALKETHDELDWLIKLITQYSVVVEQEVIR